MESALSKTKKCYKCGEIKEVGEFYKNKYKEGGLCVQCKRCLAEYGAEYYARPEVKKRKAEWYAKPGVKKRRVERMAEKYANLEYRKMMAEYRQHKKEHPEFVDIPQEWYFNSLKENAKKRGHKFNLTYNQLVKSYNGGICPLSGRKLFLTKTHTQAPGNQTASLDRIDSSKGYEVGNIQWVGSNINRSKNTFSQLDFIQMCRDVYWIHPGPHS